MELTTIDLLIIDDFALEPMSREETRDIDQLVVERNARAATIVTSNRDAAEWLSVFDDTLLAQRGVDRFKNDAYDLVVDGELSSLAAQTGCREGRTSASGSGHEAPKSRPPKTTRRRMANPPQQNLSGSNLDRCRGINLPVVEPYTLDQ